METLTRLTMRRTFFGFVAAALIAAVAADAAPFKACVIWSHGDRAYLVARDSVWVRPGSSLRFFDKKKEIAAGVVAALQDTTLVVARITSGSLARVKHLDRLRVDAESAAPPTMVALRIGYPSSARVQPFFACRRMTLDARDYQVDTLTARSYRLFRTSSGAAGPDTLLIRLFDDAADEEIALERGELDAAMFWPGEASTHIRQVMNWNERLSACRYRGVVTTQILNPPYNTRTDYDYTAFYGLPRQVDRALLDSLNTEFFHGDLHAPLGVVPGRGDEGAASFSVDPSMPSHDAIEKFLNRRTLRNPAVSYSLSYLDRPTDGEFGDLGLRWVFLICCPVLSRPELRPYLESIDLTAIVNLFDCETTARKP